ANSDIRFAIPAGCTTFTSQVGVDDEATGPGSIQFEVGNGTTTRLFQSPVKHRLDQPTPVNVALGSATTLRLVVTETGSGNSNAHGDWGSAQLQCTSPSGPPAISAIAAAPTATGATITWATNTP